MGKHLMDTQYEDLMNLTELLKRLVDSYRLLIGGAAELNNIYPRKKSDVEDALDRVDEVGEVIDDLIKVIETHGEKYLEYIHLKNKVINTKYEKKIMEKELNNVIQTEINNELYFQNNQIGRENDEE